MRIGHGYDAHRFSDGLTLVLGGVKIPFAKGLAAHSDGDVVLHALCDALLGAAALGDIGKHFPDNNVQYKGIDSRILLRRVLELIRDQGYGINNVDISVVAQAPKLAPYIPTMCENIAADLEIGIDCVNVKATTTEGMGFTGRGEGVEVHAVALLHL